MVMVIVREMGRDGDGEGDGDGDGDGDGNGDADGDGKGTMVVHRSGDGVAMCQTSSGAWILSVSKLKGRDGRTNNCIEFFLGGQVHEHSKTTFDIIVFYTGIKVVDLYKELYAVCSFS